MLSKIEIISGKWNDQNWARGAYDQIIGYILTLSVIVGLVITLAQNNYICGDGKMTDQVRCISFGDKNVNGPV
jgi:hypothetical protein